MQKKKGLLHRNANVKMLQFLINGCFHCHKLQTYKNQISVLLLKAHSHCVHETNSSANAQHARPGMQQNIQNALTQLEAWLHKSSAHSDSSNGRSTNGPLRWPAPGQAKEALDTLLRSLIRLHAEQVHICSLSEEHPVGLSCGPVTTGLRETSSDLKLMSVPLSEHSTDVGEIMC